MKFDVCFNLMSHHEVEVFLFISDKFQELLDLLLGYLAQTRAINFAVVIP